jgi:hypothetical protein
VNREKIMAAKAPSEAVEVKEWAGEDGDGTVYIKSLNSAEYANFWSHVEAVAKESTDPTTVGLILVMHCLTDKEGKRILNDDDLPVLQSQPGYLVNNLAVVANRLNDITGLIEQVTQKK